MVADWRSALNTLEIFWILSSHLTQTHVSFQLNLRSTIFEFFWSLFILLFLYFHFFFLFLTDLTGSKNESISLWLNVRFKKLINTHIHCFHIIKNTVTNYNNYNARMQGCFQLSLWKLRLFRFIFRAHKRAICFISTFNYVRTVKF